MTGNETTVGHTKADSTDTYIGRGPSGRHMLNTTIGKRGWLGNPYVTVEHGGDYTREESIDLFRDDFYDRLGSDAEFRAAVDELAGDTLGGWCQRVDDDAPACHGEVIADYLNGDGPETLTDAEQTAADSREE